ncbi:MAG: hypothetical protein ISP24_02345 [Rickettsiales bacterium]|nr:hypothetical protein [Rickettsiales bacterium]
MQKDLLQEAIYKKPEMIIVLLENGINKNAQIKDSKGKDITILDFLIKKLRWFTDNEDVNKYIDSQNDNEVDSWKEKVSGGVASRCLSAA